MAANSTVHTVEVSGVCDAFDNGFTWTAALTRCLSNVHKVYGTEDANRIKAVINPHKIELTDNGQFVFNYLDADQIESTIAQVCAEMQMQDATLSRVDICVDFNTEYQTNEKLLRFILVLMGCKYGFDNRMQTTDFVTQESKCTRASNGTSKNKTLEVEHYNRALLDQTNWDNAPVINRLEFRAMRAQTRGKTLREIAQEWIKRLEKTKVKTRADLARVEDFMNGWLWADWLTFADKCGSDNAHIWAKYLCSKAEFIYTHRQLVKLYGRYCGEDKAQDLAKHFKYRHGKLFTVFSPADINAQIDDIINAIQNFIR